MSGILKPPGLGPAGRPGSLLSRLLVPASSVYGTVALLRRRWLDARATRLDRPVVSVGNVTCGGTGKTPTVEMVVRDLIALGRRPAILSRGYAAARGRENDEARLLAANLPHVPHFTGRDRRASGAAAIAAGADVLVLDDGFQHRRLARDLDLVLIDAIVPFGYGRTLPSGLLREPIGVLREADLLGITRSELVDAAALDELDRGLERRFPGVPRLFLEAEAVECRPLSGAGEPIETLRGRRVLAFCGIGNPEAFRRLLLRLGARVEDLLVFRDHHPYGPEDLRRIEARARELAVDRVVLTQKDAVKIPPDGPGSAWCWIRIAQRISRGEDVWRAKLRSIVDRAEDELLSL